MHTSSPLFFEQLPQNGVISNMVPHYPKWGKSGVKKLAPLKCNYISDITLPKRCLFQILQMTTINNTTMITRFIIRIIGFSSSIQSMLRSSAIFFPLNRDQNMFVFNNLPSPGVGAFLRRTSFISLKALSMVCPISA